ncbi:SDR family oxidoreductase [Actinoallomurus bryophytorum]|uniref:Nucleoside-diphosphate-sugar epimerase n=1 Tax=Actinoallomurus bryophytorum TaxID=1490222 RepID=A0A543BT09_9ACTN|nr:NAD-dependent epimerase/dehydratase family protein [Actinoallomurus bryophytorum]TQL87968.1 nucleoside-diphosphate-sugar epimerase [Actinoallomurus bryophytorum]
MRVFITGAGGYVGGVVASRLVTAGHSVTGLARTEESERRVRRSGAGARRGGLEDARLLREAAEGADVVVHAAVDYTDPAFAAQEETALGALLDGGGGKPLIYTSSTLVLSDTGPEPVSEDRDAAAETLQPFKRRGEQRVLEAGGTVVRLGLVYGRNGSMLPTALLSSARTDAVARYVGSGETRWSAVHVDDAADLFARAVEAPASAGTLVHAVEAGAASFREIAEAIGRNAGVPAAAMTREEAAGVFGPLAGQLTRNLWVVPTRAAELYGWHPASKGVLHDLEHGSYRA